MQAIKETNFKFPGQTGFYKGKVRDVYYFGNIMAMVAHFDAYRIPEGDTSQDIGVRGRAVTGMPAFGGPQGGTRETCNWIAAAGAVDGSTATIVDRVPIYASPIDAAFAYFNI